MILGDEACFISLGHPLKISFNRRCWDTCIEDNAYVDSVQLQWHDLGSDQ